MAIVKMASEEYVDNKVGEKYTLPETGIPARDLSEEVRASLAKADAAATSAALLELGSTKADKSATYTKTEVDAIVQALKTGSRQIVETLPASGQPMVIYMVPKSASQTNNAYDEYIWTAAGAWEKIGDTEIDLSGYYTKTATNTLLAAKQDTIADLAAIRSGAMAGATAVQPESGKGLSTNDYTTAEKQKLDGIAAGAQVNVVETVKVNGVALVPDAGKAVDVTVPTVVPPSTSASASGKASDAKATGDALAAKRGLDDLDIYKKVGVGETWTLVGQSGEPFEATGEFYGTDGSGQWSFFVGEDFVGDTELGSSSSTDFSVAWRGAYGTGDYGTATRPFTIQRIQGDALAKTSQIPTQPSDIGAATAEQGAKADTAVQPSALRYDIITITNGQLQDRAVQKVELNAASTTLVLPTLTDLTGKVSDFCIDMVNAYTPEVDGTPTPTAASFQLDGTLGTDYNLIVPNGETWSDMTALAAGEMAVYYFTLSAFQINALPTWEVMKKVVELVPVPTAP